MAVVLPHEFDHPPSATVDPDALERQKAAFFKAGGKIQRIPDGVTAATVQTAGRTHSKRQKMKIEKGEF